MAVKPRAIIKGEPLRILGLVKREGQTLVLMRWTTGDSYVPYELARKHFAKLLLEYLCANPLPIG